MLFHVVQYAEEDGTDDVRRKMMALEQDNTRNEDVSNNDHCPCDALV